MNLASPFQGQVLLLASDEDARTLTAWLEVSGQHCLRASAADVALQPTQDEATPHLLVTALDTREPSARSLLQRLLSGEIFAGVPQLHVIGDRALYDKLVGQNQALIASLLPSPSDPKEFEVRVRLAVEIGRLRRQVSRDAIHDPATGLFTRDYLMSRLEEEFSRARRYRTPLSVVLFEVDHLRRIREALGGTADGIVRRVSDVLRAHVRREDVFGRTGDASFGALLPGNGFRGAAVMANKARTEAEPLLQAATQGRAPAGLSAGITTYPDNPEIEAAKDLYRHAERALAEARARGGNRIFIDEAALRKQRCLVMVADQDPKLLDLAEDLLTLDEYQIVRAETARSALETLRFRKPDLLIVDLELAESRAGRTFLEHVNEMFPGSRFPIIALSQGAEPDPAHLKRLGVDRFITKPFSPSLLRGVTRELLDAYRARR